MASTKKAKKDLPARKETKGGGVRLQNDNFTFVRGAKPKAKDLSPKKETKGGATREPRLGANDNMTFVRGVKKSKKDLSPKKTAKGGGIRLTNDNITLVIA